MMKDNFWNKLSLQFRRKIAHIIFGSAIFLLPDIFSGSFVLLILIAALAGFVLIRILNLSAAIRDYPVKSYGEIFFPLGLMIAGLSFLPGQPLAFKFGVLITTFSDALAAIFGTHLGKHRLNFYGQSKTLEGSTAFFLSAAFTAWIFSLYFPGATLFQAGLLALVLTFGELLFAFGLDNLVLPLIAGQLLLLAFGR